MTSQSKNNRLLPLTVIEAAALVKDAMYNGSLLIRLLQG